MTKRIVFGFFSHIWWRLVRTKQTAAKRYTRSQTTGIAKWRTIIARSLLIHQVIQAAVEAPEAKKPVRLQSRVAISAIVPHTNNSKPTPAARVKVFM